MDIVGGGEYDKLYCWEALEKKNFTFEKGDKTALMHDYLNTYKDNKEEPLMGCCKVAKGQKSLSRRKDCVYTTDYHPPSLIDKMDALSKKFI